jgi:hypothetical protein
MKYNIAVLLYTFDRIDDAKINQEIIRENWTAHSAFNDIKIVHTFNGEKVWWPEKYLEDDLLYLENTGHFSGVEQMINKGIDHILERYSEYDYVIMLASDTWLCRPDYVADLLQVMHDSEKYLATCAWGTKKKNNIWNIGMGLDFCILDLKWLARSQMFPLRFIDFSEKYKDIFSYQGTGVFLERVFALRFKEALARAPGVQSFNEIRPLAIDRLLRLSEREPIHLHRGVFKKKQYRKMSWPELGLLGDHYPTPKQKLFKKIALKLGPQGTIFIEAHDLSYWNNGKQERYEA